MKQTHHIGYVQTPSVKNLSNVKNALVENGLVPLTTPNEMLPDAIVEGLKKLEIHDYGMIHEGKYRIRYFDIDGTILKIEYVAEGGKLTPPSKTPNYDPDYLIFDEWNYDIENYVVEQPTDVGATYKTVDDATYMFCRFTTKTGLNPTLRISGFASIDWGDGTINTSTSHTYTKEGNYIIKIKGNLSFNVNTSNYLFGGQLLNFTLLKCYFNKDTAIGTSYMFKNCRNLEILAYKKSSNFNYYYTFDDCHSLKHLTIPKESLNITLNSTFNDCYSLESLVLPQNVTAFGSSSMSGTSIKSIVIPNGVNSIGSYVFTNMSALKELYFSSSVTTFGSNLTNDYSLNDIFVTSKFTLSNPPQESSLNYLLTFWVKDDIIEDLKVATYWSTYANRMKPLSWYPSLTDPNAE